MPSAYEKSQIVQTYVTLLPPGGGGTLYNGLYGDALPERGTL